VLVFLCVWAYGWRIRKAALSECPVDTRNRRGFAAAKRIRPPLVRFSWVQNINMMDSNDRAKRLRAGFADFSATPALFFRPNDNVILITPVFLCDRLYLV